MTERRDETAPDTGERRRAEDAMEEFALFRDKALLAIGSFITVGIALAAIFGNIHNPEVALAALTLGGTLLGAPTFLRWDESRGRRRQQ